MIKLKSTILLSLLFFLTASYTFAQENSDRKKRNKKEIASLKSDSIKAKKTTPLSINDKIKSSKKIEGLFTIYQDTVTGSMQLYIKKDQLNKEFIYQS